MSSIRHLRGVRVAVTGASGFLGSHVVRALVGVGANVTALCRGDAPRLSDLGEACTVVPFDLLDEVPAKRAFDVARPQLLIHCAAYGVQSRDRDAERATAVNVTGTLRLVVSAARAGVKTFLHVGTSHEYGEGPSLAEDAPLHPVGIYGATKAVGTIVSRARAVELGLRWLGVRPFIVYGPGEDDDKLIPYAVRCGLAGKPVMATSGETIRDFTFVSDLVDGLVAATTTPLPSGTLVNLGSGVGTRIADVLHTIAELIDGTELVLGGRRPRPDDVAVQVADTARQRATLGWMPTTSLRSGLTQTVDSFRAGREG